MIVAFASSTFLTLSGGGSFPCSSARAFLRPALRGGNVDLRTGALALRVIVENGRAAGVVYERAGQQHEVRASREVIVSAGALQTPQLLLLSGIGPAAELRATGITPVCDLPGVGRLVVARVFESDAERAQRLGAQTAHQADDNRRIDAAGKKRSERNFRHEAFLDRGGEQFSEPRLGVVV